MAMASFNSDLAALNAELEATLRALQDVPKQFTDAKVRTALRHALQPVLRTAKALTPKGTKVHYRYKGGGLKKKPKGQGVIVAAYKPGNLRKSLSILSFRRAKRSMFVGPALKLGASSGQKKYDGYYAHMLYGNAEAFRKRIGEVALSQNRDQVDARFFSRVIREIEKIKAKYNL